MFAPAVTTRALPVVCVLCISVVLGRVALATHPYEHDLRHSEVGCDECRALLGADHIPDIEAVADRFRPIERSVRAPSRPAVRTTRRWSRLARAPPRSS